MSSFSRANALRHYRSSAVVALAADVSPHQQVAMLFDGALRSLSAALVGLGHGPVSLKVEGINGALRIVSYLRAILDHERGGSVSRSLDQLYEYIIRQLALANVRGDAARISEVLTLLRTLKAGWDAIAPRAE